MQSVVEPQEQVPRCRKCGAELNGENWFPSQLSSNHRICKSCHIKFYYNKEKDYALHQKRYDEMHPDTLEERLRRRQNRFDPHCRECGKGLVSGVNWYKFFKTMHSYICTSCYSKVRGNYLDSVKPGRVKRRSNRIDPHCIHCDVKLIPGVNWLRKRQIKRERVCNKCHLDLAKDWSRKHPTKSHAIKVKWRALHQDRYRESNIVQAHRRRRHLTSRIIIGRWFSGSHLHHLTPDVCIYIPSSINKRFHHNVLTGKGMPEVNSAAFSWYFGTPVIVQTIEARLQERLQVLV